MGYSVPRIRIIATAIGLSTRQPIFRVWNENFLWSAPSYFVGALASAVAASVIDRGGYWMASLAAAPGPPQNVRIETKKLVNDSTLDWEAPKDGRATSYEVLWRATSAPDWEHSLTVGNVLKTTIPVSKDNVIFAVQSMDEAGHSSEPVVPAPER